MSKKFTEYSQLNLSDINKEVLKKWDENDVFSRSMTEREGHPSFVFYEGPPSANGMPGILGGNILNILGNYILIYGKLGMPEMGLVGNHPP